MTVAEEKNIIQETSLYLQLKLTHKHQGRELNQLMR